MHLTCLHYHFRPGGVRTVIENGLPALISGRVDGITMASGEPAPKVWRETMNSALHPVPVTWVVNAAFSYQSERTTPPAEAMQAANDLVRLGGIIWAHNLSIGRNVPLAMALPRVCAAREADLWLHHHDLWWDGRWERWADFVAGGITDIDRAVAITLPQSRGIHHFTINADQAREIASLGGVACKFVGNPLSVTPPPFQSCIAAAREFLTKTCDGPAWLYPTRLLRRKNIAEALLVQRWLSPASALATTGGSSSPIETNYGASLNMAAAKMGLRYYPGICLNTEHSIPALVAAAETLIMTSLREGFALPLYEATGRNLLARRLPGLHSTMKSTGLSLRHSWSGLPVPITSFDHMAELARLNKAMEAGIGLLPSEWQQDFAYQTPSLDGTCDFGNLTLAGQLEVLASSPALPRILRNFSPILPQPAPLYWADFSPTAWAETIWSHGTRVSHFKHPVAAASLIKPMLRRWLAHPLLLPHGGK